jgi:hypothetical protein
LVAAAFLWKYYIMTVVDVVNFIGEFPHRALPDFLITRNVNLQFLFVGWDLNSLRSLFQGP